MTDAKDFCISKKSKLAALDSSKKMDAILEYLQILISKSIKKFHYMIFPQIFQFINIYLPFIIILKYYFDYILLISLYFQGQKWNVFTWISLENRLLLIHGGLDRFSRETQIIGGMRYLLLNVALFSCCPTVYGQSRIDCVVLCAMHSAWPRRISHFGEIWSRTFKNFRRRDVD